MTYIWAWQAAAGGGAPAGALDPPRAAPAPAPPQPRAAVPLRDQRGEPAGGGERVHELRGIASQPVLLAPVHVAEAAAELADGGADLGIGGVALAVRHRAVQPASITCAAPVMPEASSEQRKRAYAATSPGSRSRF